MLIAFLVPQMVLPPAMVYGINGAEGFLKNKKRLLTWS